MNTNGHEYNGARLCEPQQCVNAGGVQPVPGLIEPAAGLRPALRIVSVAR